MVWKRQSIDAFADGFARLWALLDDDYKSNTDNEYVDRGDTTAPIQMQIYGRYWSIRKHLVDGRIQFRCRCTTPHTPREQHARIYHMPFEHDERYGRKNRYTDRIVNGMFIDAYRCPKLGWG